MPDPTNVKLHHVALIAMYLHAKNQLYTSFGLWNIKSLKILQSNWPRAFLHLTQETDFSKTCSFNRITKVIMVHDLNSKNTHISRLSFFAKSKRLYFWDVFGHYPQNDIFHKKSVSIRFLLLRHLTSWEVSEKPYEPFWRKRIYLLTYWHTDKLIVVKS